jgi:predicted RNA-binding protein with PIN domain
LTRTVVLVDAENVRRSRWPNVGPVELVELVAAWTEREDVDAVVVFDGPAPEGGPECVEVVGTSGETADDWITRAAAKYVAEGRPYRLATSDRGLRAAAGRSAEQIVGGGAYLQELLGGG